MKLLCFLLIVLSAYATDKPTLRFKTKPSVAKVDLYYIKVPIGSDTPTDIKFDGKIPAGSRVFKPLAWEEFNNEVSDLALVIADAKDTLISVSYKLDQSEKYIASLHKRMGSMQDTFERNWKRNNELVQRDINHYIRETKISRNRYNRLKTETKIKGYAFTLLGLIKLLKD